MRGVSKRCGVEGGGWVWGWSMRFWSGGSFEWGGYQSYDLGGCVLPNTSSHHLHRHCVMSTLPECVCCWCVCVCVFVCACIEAGSGAGAVQRHC